VTLAQRLANLELEVVAVAEQILTADKTEVLESLSLVT
jgi:hypothetical protein